MSVIAIPNNKDTKPRALDTQINVYDIDGTTISNVVSIPEVFKAELRPDIVLTVHNSIKLNGRQPYAVSPDAGKQHSAISLGTGRALARVPRVKGSGTSRCGQAAFANFARKGHMAHPLSLNRRLKVKISKKQRKIAYVSAIAATGISDIVEGRGHRISEVNMLPIVVSDSMNSIKKTKDAMELLNKLGCKEDIERVKKSKTITCGKGKLRNRRYNKRRGPLIIHNNDDLLAFKGIKEVDMMDINNIDILKLSPGGKLGRLVIWTESAFMKLNELYGMIYEDCKMNGKQCIPKPFVSTEDLDLYFYSREIQSIIPNCNLLEKGNCKMDTEEMARKEAYIKLFKSS